ncbi:MAG: trypsin-like peptidase domain-containing protein [Marinirhabdus sp.]
MRQTLKLITVAVIAAAATLGGNQLMKKETATPTTLPAQNHYVPTNYTPNGAAATSTDFTQAAEMTVNAVVHVKNTSYGKEPRNMMEYIYGSGKMRPMEGVGSGVVISPDGYIVTNNHVIANAAQLEVTLNDNRVYEAELIGSDPKTDIVPFGNSDNLRLGEWVLAVGNPFNLTSTVTAGIVSAKARDLNEFDRNPQSFIQTDAAVNRGNSGGALVNVRGELVGINTAITSETGSYVGYSFAVPSNNARKIIEDIMEFGNVQRGILGISGANVNDPYIQNQGVEETEGVYISNIERGSGAESSGLKKGDVIKEIDGFKIAKFSDLTGYIGAKRPNDIVDVKLVRNGKIRNIPVTLIKLEAVEIDDLGIEVRNANIATLNNYGLKSGVIISETLTKDMNAYGLRGSIVTHINDIKIADIDDVKRVINRRDFGEDIKLTFVKPNGQVNTFIFR